MELFRKTISGIDFAFNLQEEEGEFYYKIKAENLNFLMRISKYGTWKFYSPVPLWVKELEESLGKAIDNFNK